MKEKEYGFSSHTKQGGRHSKKELIKALKKYAIVVRKPTFTQKEYDSWGDKPLGSAQIRVRFGSWGKAMEAAGMRPLWKPKRSLKRMIKIYRKCWKKDDEMPTEKRLAEYLIKKGEPYTVNLYKKYFGGLRRLAENVQKRRNREITKKELLERYDFALLKKTHVVYCLRSTRDKSPRYVGETHLELGERLRQHLSLAGKKNKGLCDWMAGEKKDGFQIEIDCLQKGAVRGVHEKAWITKLLNDGIPLLNVAFANADNRHGEKEVQRSMRG